MTDQPFSILPLQPSWLANLDRLGYRTMTPIQALALPAMLAGQDVLGQAGTGTGKTAAFGLAVLARTAPRCGAPGRADLVPDPRARGPGRRRAAPAGAAAAAHPGGHAQRRQLDRARARDVGPRRRRRGRDAGPGRRSPGARAARPRRDPHRRARRGRSHARDGLRRGGRRDRRRDAGAAPDAACSRPRSPTRCARSAPATSAPRST
jgi:hypothetical protein